MLVLLNPGFEPLGQFEGLDSILSTVKGGEVLSLQAVASNAGAADALDGYQPAGTQIVLNFPASSSANPLFLCDDGLLHYGTLLGAIVGGTVGQQVNGYNTYTGAVLGPNTTTGSGKITAWDKPGLYGVTLDACDQVTCQPSNSALVGGVTALYGTVGGSTPGFLTTTSSGNTAQVGTYVEFRSNGSLVTTPNRLVSALNSPSSVVGGVLPPTLYMMVFHFNGV
jgi:hypothetical protein